MDILQAIIYGVVQGIGEFLPISSTAHLDLLPWFFKDLGWVAQPKYFDMALHFGTAIAVVVFFFKDWLVLVAAGFTKPKSPDGRLFWLIAVATIPAAVVGVVLNDLDFSTNYLLIGIMLIVMGAVLYVADKLGKIEGSVASGGANGGNGAIAGASSQNVVAGANAQASAEAPEVGLKRGILVGISQALAIIPGVSRSGITMATGRFLGMTRAGIARFSFLMSTPIILADALFQAKDMVKDTSLQLLPFIIAILTSAVVGMLSIRFLLNYLKTKGFGIFVIYRFVLGAFVIVLFFLRG